MMRKVILAIAGAGWAQSADVSSLVQWQTSPVNPNPEFEDKKVSVHGTGNTQTDFDNFQKRMKSMKPKLQSVVASLSRARPGNVTFNRSDLLEAVTYLKDVKLSSSAMRKTSECKGMCIATIVIDVALLAFDVWKSTCLGILVLVWFACGVATLMKDQGLTFPESVDALMQMFTTVGWGSYTPSTKGLKVFHAMHEIVSSMAVNDLMVEVTNSLLVLIEKPATALGLSKIWSLAYAGVLIVTGFVLMFAYDLKTGPNSAAYTKWQDVATDALYGSFITATTVGYGDIAFSTELAQGLSFFTVPLVAKMWNVWAEYVTAGTLPDDHEVSLGTKIAECKF